MGQSSSKSKQKGKYSRTDIENLAKMTHFTPDQVQFLYDRFKFLSNSQSKDNKISLHEFQQALDLPNTEFTQRIFSAFDSDNSDQIEFDEFVLGLSAMSPNATIEEKAKFCFNVYDIDGNHTIDKNELKQILTFSLKSNSQISISDDVLDKVVQKTFSQVDKNNDNEISLSEFTEAAKANPSILTCVNLKLLVI